MSTHIVLEEPTVKPGEETEKSYAPRVSGGGRRGGPLLYRRLAYPDLSLPGIARGDGVERDRRHRGHAQGRAEAAAGFGADVQVRHLAGHADSPCGRHVGRSTAVCTHLGCTVQYEPQADRIHCACHGGVYNAYTGANVSGPPPKPLKLFKVAVSDIGVKVSRA